MKMNLDFNKGGVVLLPTKTEKQVFEKSLLYVSTLKKGCGFIPEINAACDKALEGLQAILDKLQESEADDDDAAAPEVAAPTGKKAPTEPPPSPPEESIEGLLDPDEGASPAADEESVQDEGFEEFDDSEESEEGGVDTGEEEFVDDEEQAVEEAPAPAPAKAAPVKAAAAKPMTLEQRKAALLAGKAKK